MHVVCLKKNQNYYPNIVTTTPWYQTGYLSNMYKFQEIIL